MTVTYFPHIPYQPYMVQYYTRMQVVNLGGFYPVYSMIII